MEIMIKQLVLALFPGSCEKKEFCSDSLWTKFGPCPKRPKLSEYATDIKVIMKELI